MPIENPFVLYNNQHFAVVVKPAGMNFHSEDGEPGFVVQATEILRREDKAVQVYPVHRLDQMTSGLVLLALNHETAQAFQILFEQREVEKYYLAISTEKPKKKQGWIKGDMQPARRGSWKLTASKEAPAITRFMSVSIGANQRLFLIKPFTGKTHQIRVALKSIGAPIAGDIRYEKLEKARLESRGYLHAFALKFNLFGENYRFSCPPTSGERFLTDASLEQIRLWQQPWQAFNDP